MVFRSRFWYSSKLNSFHIYQFDRFIDFLHFNVFFIYKVVLIFFLLIYVFKIFIYSFTLGSIVLNTTMQN